MERLRLHRIERRRLLPIQLLQLRVVREGVAGGEEREVEKREVRRWRRGEDEPFEVDELLLFGAEPAIRDGADAEALRRFRDRDGKLELEDACGRADENSGQREDRQTFVVLNPDPEGLDRAVLLLRPLERLAQLKTNAEEVVCEGLEGARDLERGELAGGGDSEGTETLVLADERTEVGGGHDGDFLNGNLVRPSLDIVDEVGGEGELGERVSERPHALCGRSRVSTINEETGKGKGNALSIDLLIDSRTIDTGAHLFAIAMSSNALTIRPAFCETYPMSETRAKSST